MEMLALVLTIALLVVAIFVGMFVWAVRNGQLDDLETPAQRMLHEDGPAAAAAKPEGRMGVQGKPEESPRRDPVTGTAERG
jgi:cbb3-type cytochrome oxidase maturation protein